LSLTLGCLGAGALVDRFGPGPVLAGGCAVLPACSYALYLGAARDPGLLLPLYALTGLFVAIVAVVPSVMVRSFPPAVRFSGLSFSYNLAYAVFGGITPPLVALLVKADPLGPVHYVAALCAAGVVAGLLVARRGKSFAA
jgi:MFS family permease